MKDRIKREKAWIGAVIGAALGVGGGAAGAIMKHKQEKRAKREQIKQEGYTQAANMSNAYNNQSYVDEYNKRYTLKCGGRKKFEDGGSNNIDWDSELSSALPAVNNLTNTILQNSNGKRFPAFNFKVNDTKQNLVANSYDNNNNVINDINRDRYIDRIKSAKFGMRKRRRN